MSKKPVERSASYPAITIAEALEFTEKVAKNFTASQIVKREDIAAVLQMSVQTIPRDIAACANYGFLLKQQKEGYQIAPLYKTYNNAVSDDEKKLCLLTAFNSPKLYKELIKKFDGHAIPPELKTHLIRFHKIAENAAPLAADVFIKNAKFCEVLTEHNILKYHTTLSTLVNPNPTGDGIGINNVLQRNEQDSELHVNGVQDGKPKEILLLNLMNNAVEKKITLSEGKFAVWKYPNNMNKKDIEIFKKELEILELIIA